MDNNLVKVSPQITDQIDGALPPLLLLPAPEPKRIDVRLNELIAIHGILTYTALQRDEATAEYVDLKVQVWKGGHFVQPAAGGYQKNNRCISEAARELLTLGRTEEGRRKHIERALKVANLPAEVKAAAVAAGLENRRSALLEIAQGRTPEAQLKILAEFVERKGRKSLLKKLANSGQSDWQQASAMTKDVAPVLEVLPIEYSGSIVPSEVNPDRDEAYSALMAAWLSAPGPARERFIVFLHTEARANGD